MDFTYEENLQLIACFKQHPIIYDVNSIGYYDRKAKVKAWNTIAGEMKVHREVVKRKMESLLSSYRREKAKVIKGINSKDPKDTYKPKWRYWNAFKFLRGVKDDDVDPYGSVPNDVPPPKNDTPWTTARLLAHKYRNVPYPIPYLKKSENTEQEENQNTLNDEYSTFGDMVEEKLQKLSKKQRYYAKNIINQILYNGLLFQLTSKSEIRDENFPSESLKTATSNESAASSDETIEDDS